MDFVSQQLFALDFDEGTTINEEINRCKELNILPVFGYTSFSHKEEHHKFRLVFCVDRVITNAEIRNNIQLILMNVFTNVDTKCKDISRLFFGGKKLIISNYEKRINVDWLLNTYGDLLTNIVQKKTKNNNCEISKKVKRNRSRNSYDKEIINQKVKAISELNVGTARDLIGLDTTPPNRIDIFAIRGGSIPMTKFIETPTIVSSQKEFFNYINALDLNNYLGIPEGTMVKCILPSHDDNAPSAHIYTTDKGTQMYKCFGCNKARTIIGITEELAQCKRSEAIEFIKSVYNIQLVQSSWVSNQKQLMLDSANYLNTDEFKEQFPELSKIIRTRKSHIQQMLVHFTQYISDNLNVDGKPLFFASYDTLMKICEIKSNDSHQKLSQTLILFTLLNMLDKVEEERIPVEELKKAKAIAAKYGHKKLTGFYQFGEYGVLQLSESEKKAKMLKENNMTLGGLSREYVYRTFGKAEADRCFPQYRHENSKGTTEKSDNQTLKIVRKIAKKIDKQGYIFERDIKKNKRNELQWRKSISDVLNSYGWKKVKLNKQLKEQFGITVKGYPFLIVKM